MCGLAGFYNKSGINGDALMLMKKMLSQMQYRGPDESGIFKNSNIAMGHVRLSILDLETGQQPLSVNDGKYWIVFNGEIFNFSELRRELEGKGIKFQTRSDTEVLLHAYIEYGTECLNKFNGQFALAIWNNQSEELFLARDRVGVRPLFYSWSGSTLVFGSEIKAILEYPGIKAEIDYTALKQVFTLWTSISPRTVFQNILELQPGHYMLVTPEKTVTKAYWNLKIPSSGQSIFKGTFQEAAGQLEDLLTDAVRLRLHADVPVAAYLSGGIDSSAIVAMIKSIAPNNLKTFSIGFEDAEFDETPYQKEVSDYLNTNHTYYTCTKNDIARFFPSVVWHAEIPVLRTGPVPMYCLARKVRETGTKVVITGEGSDEMLGGYDIFKEALIRDFWSRQPHSQLRPLLFNRLYPYLAQFEGKNRSVLRLFYGYKLSETESPFYSHLLRWHNTASLLKYTSGTFKSHAGENNIYKDLEEFIPPDFNEYSRLGKAQWLEIFLFMSGYLLSTQGDRMGMAHSIEGRYPFLDHRVIEFSAMLPAEFKIRGLNEKYILKKMMNGRLPDSVLKRQKQPYRAPMASGFISSEGNRYIPELISEQALIQTGIFDYEMVTKLFEKIRGGSMATEIENMAMVAIISTQILIHQYIIKDAFRPAPGELKNLKIYS